MPTFHSSYLAQRGHLVAPKPRARRFGAGAENRLSFTM